MTTYTTTAITSFVMGTDAMGNRSMVTLKSGVEYELDPATIQYDNALTSFPASV